MFTEPTFAYREPTPVNAKYPPMMNYPLLVLCICCSLFTGFQALAREGQQSAKIAPGLISSDDYFYVMGPRGDTTSGRDDSLQVVFFRVPVNLQGSFYLFVKDPGSSGSDGLLSFLRATVRTTYTIYGGEGTWTSAAARSVRPSSRQLGRVLARQVFVDNDKAWVSFGPFTAAHGEAYNGYAYFKLMAQANSGAGINLFKVGISTEQAEIFSYDVTLRLGGVTGDQLQVMVDVPPGTKAIKEYNFDFDDGGTPSLDGINLIASQTGKWTGNRVTTDGLNLDQRLSYVLLRGEQSRPNLGFHFTDSDDRALAMFFPGPVTPIVVERVIPQDIPPPRQAEQVRADPPPPPPLPDGDNCVVVDGFLANLTACLPPQVVIGEEFPGTITVYGKQNAIDAVVRTEMPAGLTFLGSSPEATLDGQTLSWTFDKLEPGDEIEIDLRLRADAEGTLTHCPRITARQMICQPLSVAKPVLTISKTGPALVGLGSDLEYLVQVTNSSKIMARNVILTDELPPGLTHVSDNRTLTYRLGDLKPGESRQVSVAVTAAESGEHVNKATAVAEHAEPVSAEAVTRVTRPNLEITKTGTEEQYVGKAADYRIEVLNSGDTVLTNLVIVDQLPADTRLLEAGGGEAADGQVTWQLPELQPGKQHVFELKLTARISGTTINSVQVDTAEGLTASSQTWTRWIGHPGLLIEVVDTSDPLTVGQQTSYKILITNQGTAPDLNVRILATFPPELRPLKASGDSVTRVSGRTVSVAPVEVLAPGQSVTWQIEVEAEKTGDGRVKVDMTSQMLGKPVTEVESTHVY